MIFIVVYLFIKIMIRENFLILNAGQSCPKKIIFFFFKIIFILFVSFAYNLSPFTFLKNQKHQKIFPTEK